MKTFIKIHPADNVVVCLSALAEGTVINVDGEAITLRQTIPAGHKCLVKAIAKGDPVVKYGFPIGYAQSDMQPGTWINEHNLLTTLKGTPHYTYEPNFNSLPQPTDMPTFKGYKRSNGTTGIRNEIWIVPTVGCVNGIARKLAELLRQETALQGIDGVHAWTHNYGCSQLGGDHENTRKILRDICLHPNAGGVLVLSLGCENNQPDEFMRMLGNYDKNRIKLLVTQKVEGDEVEAGMNLLRQLYHTASKDTREPVPVSELKIGLKCGGSDGFSGITANPLVGRCSDYFVAHGASTILTEVPEMFGAETILMNRCVNEKVFQQTVKLINNFKQYYLDHGEPVGENPSPGNKAGGISTLEDKALGCTQKSGDAPVSGVLQYGEPLHVKGLNLLSAPGNDLVASTALAASGCQLVLFTTGRGTPFGTFVPTMKIATNSLLAKNKHRWIDFDAGRLLSNHTMEELTAKLVNKIIAVASGERVNSEINDYSDIAIFKNGVTL